MPHVYVQDEFRVNSKQPELRIEERAILINNFTPTILMGGHIAILGRHPVCVALVQKIWLHA